MKVGWSVFVVPLTRVNASQKLPDSIQKFLTGSPLRPTSLTIGAIALRVEAHRTVLNRGEVSTFWYRIQRLQQKR